MSKNNFSQRGVYLVLFAVVTVVLVALLGLLIGSGFLASNRTLIQNTANNVALAALEGYSSTRSQNFHLRACVGRTRAERVLEQNEVKGMGDMNSVHLSDHQVSVVPDAPLEEHRDRCLINNPTADQSVGRIVYGRWIEDQVSDPEFNPAVLGSGTVRCRVGGEIKYPCFLAEGGIADAGAELPSSTQVSAVRVDLSVTSDAPIYLPVGGGEQHVSAKSYGVVVPRCFAGVVDLSYSSVEETHPLPNSTTDLYGAEVAGPYRTTLSDVTECDDVNSRCNILCPAGGNGASADLAAACNNLYCTTNARGGSPGYCYDGDDELPVCIPDTRPNPPMPFRCYAESVMGHFESVGPEMRNAAQNSWERPWIPARHQWILPRRDAIQPPFLGLPFIPLADLRLPGSTPPRFFDPDGCALRPNWNSFFSPFIWCNMWRGRTSADVIDVPPAVPWGGYVATADYDDYNQLASSRDSRQAHFWSDFDPFTYQQGNAGIPSPDRAWMPRASESPYGPLMVDKLISAPVNGKVGSTGPEPLSRYLAAMNASFRLVSEQSAAGDRGLVLGFAGDLMHEGDLPARRQVAIIPGDGMENAGGATPDLHLLAQVTNPLGKGAFYWNGSSYTNVDPSGPSGQNRFAEFHPNFVDVGLVSRFVLDPNNQSRVGHTNILKALLAAKSRILNPLNGSGCGPGAIKSIVLFTDGVNTCAPEQFAPGAGWENYLLNDRPGGLNAPPDHFVCDPRTDAANSRYGAYYDRYEQFLFGEGANWPANIKGLMQSFKDARISFSAVVDGKAMRAAWMPVMRPGWTSESHESQYLRFSELRSAGVGVQMSIFPHISVTQDGLNPLSDADGYAGAGSEAYFRRPLETLGRLAYETGGILWPTLPLCTAVNNRCAGCDDAECYVSQASGAELRDCAWGGAGAAGLRCSPLNLSEAEQAAWVMVQSVGQKPFSLRAPVAGDISDLP